jgi:hypothetical protein
MSSDEIADLGDQIYEEWIKPGLTQSDIGKFVHIDVNSGEFEIDDDDITGDIQLRTRIPEAVIYTVRVGYSATYFFGGYSEEPKL